MSYESLSPEVQQKILAARADGTASKYAFKDADIKRRISNEHDNATIIRPAFVRDVDKIMHCPYYNRYADKTQVFSFYKNDDITRRFLHVQLVSRIARTIGTALGLNIDLIEAIALGHDIGHTPFGHAGEYILDDILSEHTGRHFAHNIQSVRVLDGIFPYNLSLQTLSGIASHNGEVELRAYAPNPDQSFESFDEEIEKCYQDINYNLKLVPSTLEGCVVRISDIIAYLGKDRQDASRAHLVSEEAFEDGVIGNFNAMMINNLVTNIVENSFGKPYIEMDEEHFKALAKAKKDNGELIYTKSDPEGKIANIIRPMMENVYEKLLYDLTHQNIDSPIFTHHIKQVEATHYKRRAPYISEEPNQVVVDYIASMTDDYFLELYKYLFPEDKKSVEYVGYFE